MLRYCRKHIFKTFGVRNLIRYSLIFRKHTGDIKSGILHFGKFHVYIAPFLPRLRSKIQRIIFYHNIKKSKQKIVELSALQTKFI